MLASFHSLKQLKECVQEIKPSNEIKKAWISGTRDGKSWIWNDGSKVSGELLNVTAAKDDESRTVLRWNVGDVFLSADYTTTKMPILCELPK